LFSDITDIGKFVEKSSDEAWKGELYLTENCLKFVSGLIAILKKKSSQSLLLFLSDIPFLGISNSACVCATYGVNGRTVSVYQ